MELGHHHRADGRWRLYAFADAANSSALTAWAEWMRTVGWRRFGLYTWDQGPGLHGDWNGRLAPSFEFVFHFNRKARRANKIVPCKWAGD